jgi:DNA-binding CsgD family transcriptional regulator
MPRSLQGWSASSVQRLRALRAQGLSNGEIADQLGTTEQRLEAEISRLIDIGELRSRRGLLWSHPDSWVQGHERTPADVAPDVARLYMAGMSYKQIASELTLTESQVHNLLTGLFAEGMPKRGRHELSDEQVKDMHARWRKDHDSIDQMAKALGFTGRAVRVRMKKLGLTLNRGRGG